MKCILVIIALCAIQIVTSSVCYWNTGCPYKYFSNKTPYNFVRGDIRDSVVHQKGCEPISIWGLVRHGKRNPSKFFAEPMFDALRIKNDILNSYEIGNCSLCAQDVENLRQLQENRDLFEKPFDLTEEGYQESVGIGRRLKQAFPKLLAKLERNDYLFHPAPGGRMMESAKAFVQGFNVTELYINIDPPKGGFDVASPFENCRSYITNVRNNPESSSESTKYLSSSEYLAFKDKIHRRLGITYALNDVNLTGIYDLCRYTSSGDTGNFSPWCALFTSEDLKVLEYYYDLKNYQRNAHGTPINGLFGQITLADLFRSFQEAKNGNGKKITAYISHATMMDMVYTALELFNDSFPLSSSRRDPYRKWRASKLAGFSSNLMAVLNKCNKEADDYNVVFYLNEEPLLSICKKGVCTWREFEDKLSPFLKTNIDCDS